MTAADSAVLCVDIGGTSTKVGLLHNGNTDLLDVVPSAGPAVDFVAALSQAIGAAQEQIASRGLVVAGAGIAVAGFLDDERSRMIYNSNLPWLENYPLLDQLSGAVQLPLSMEVDSNAAAIAEHQLGAGVSARRFLCITAGTGLGVGFIVHNQPLRFAYGCLGDIGHVIVQPDGPLCTCGGRGCAEILVSAPRLAAAYRERSGKDTPRGLRDVIESARQGDSDAIATLQAAGRWLGIATASMASIFFPDRIAIAGGLAEAGDFVMDSLQQEFASSAGEFARKQTTIARARLGALATLTGAGLAFLSNKAGDHTLSHATP